MQGIYTSFTKRDRETKIAGESFYNFKRKVKDKFVFEALINGVKKGDIKNQINFLLENYREKYLLIQGGHKNE